jgi:hypothetical protein
MLMSGTLPRVLRHHLVRQSRETLGKQVATLQTRWNAYGNCRQHSNEPKQLPPSTMAGLLNQSIHRILDRKETRVGSMDTLEWHIAETILLSLSQQDHRGNMQISLQTAFDNNDSRQTNNGHLPTSCCPQTLE